jgi:hypothetical protein
VYDPDLWRIEAHRADAHLGARGWDVDNSSVGTPEPMLLICIYLTEAYLLICIYLTEECSFKQGPFNKTMMSFFAEIQTDFFAGFE